MYKYLSFIFVSVLLAVNINCSGSSSDDKNGGDEDGGGDGSSISIKLGINNPKALFIDKNSSASGKYRSDIPGEGGDLYQITTDDLMEKVDFVDPSNGDEEIEARISQMRKISDKYIVVQLEVFTVDYDETDVSAIGDSVSYILVVDLETGSTYDLGEHGSIFNWSNSLYDDPIAIGKNIYFIESNTLKKINFETLEVVSLSNPDAYAASGIMQLQGNYVLTDFYNGGWQTVLIEENMTLPTFLSSDDKTYLEEFYMAHFEGDFSIFGLINDCNGNLYDVDIIYDSVSGNSTAKFISFGVDSSDQLTVSETDIITFTGTGAPDTSSVTNRSFDYRWSNSLSITDKYRMLVLDYGYVYVESNAPNDGFTYSSQEVDLSFLFDADGHPIFKFYDSATKICWKDGADLNYYDLVNGAGSGDVQAETITGLAGVYTVGDKILYTKLVSLTSTETYEFNPSGDDVLLSSSEMSIDTILEF